MLQSMGELRYPRLVNCISVMSDPMMRYDIFEYFEIFNSHYRVTTSVLRSTQRVPPWRPLVSPSPARVSWMVLEGIISASLHRSWIRFLCCVACTKCLFPIAFPSDTFTQTRQERGIGTQKGRADPHFPLILYNTCTRNEP